MLLIIKLYYNYLKWSIENIFLVFIELFSISSL